MEYRLPDESGRLDGIAWALWLPNEAVAVEGQQRLPAVMILHGAGSQKENHADFARLASNHGFVALTFDNRGHGETDGELGPSVMDDLRALARFLAQRPEVDEGRVAVRGSSMGGLLAIHLAAESPDVAAVVAICPAAEWMLAQDVGRAAEGRPPRPGSAMESMRIDAPGLLAWLDGHDVGNAVERLGKPLLLVHARGDEVVPDSHSQDLRERAPDSTRLLLLDGGDHRSAQHDAEVQGEALRWLGKVM